MKEFIPFLVQHWILSASFLLVFILIIFYESKDRWLGTKNISSQELIQWMNENKAVVIDLRDPKSFSKGHITNSENLSMDQLISTPKLLKKYKTQRIVFITETGEIPFTFTLQISKLLPTIQIATLESGIEGWTKSELPLVSGN